VYVRALMVLNIFQSLTGVISHCELLQMVP
jgi:hypothetical protein